MAEVVKAIIPLVGISTGKTKVKFETEGFTGTGCQAATEAFERALGSVSDEEFTAEYYDTEERHEHLNDGEV